MAAETSTWHERKTTGTPPAERCRHTLSLIQSKQLLVIGGYGKNDQPLKGQHILHLGLWDKMNLFTKNVVCEKKITSFVFFEWVAECNLLLIFCVFFFLGTDDMSWTHFEIGELFPLTRAGHTTTSIIVNNNNSNNYNNNNNNNNEHHVLVVFGGYDSSGRQTNDLFLLDTRMLRTWNKKFPSK